jgi:UDP-N-acetylmuramoyl-L-alanyl-D-glutamate--2,6-diaminopimelate ligase
MSALMPLQRLAEGLFDAAGFADAEIHGLCVDSRALAKGDAFIAVPGFSAHGLSYLTPEQAANAAVVLVQPPVPDAVAVPANALLVEDLKSKQAQLASRFYGQPSQHLHMVGVTGTNGKTSSVQMIAQAMSLLGRRAGTIGTLGTGLYGQLRAGERTTPDVIAVHRALAEMRAAGAQCVAMEVSSHALDQARVAEVAFDTAVFTNLTLDHLDYHGSMQAYFEAKAKLFQWPGLRSAVINADDAYGRELAALVPAGVQCIRTSSVGNTAELQAEAIALSLQGMQFDLVSGHERVPVCSALLGRFNVDNLLAVAGVLQADGLALADIGALLSGLDPVGGRMSRLGGNGKALVVVDYAHTPDALEQALLTLRGHTRARLLCVFGCGGDRDRSKRPHMAAIAETLADAIWLTDDNPRTESGDAIIADMQAGLRRPEHAHIVRDRRAAIAAAIAAASAEDIVLIAGKGHETYQEVSGVRTAFDDRAIAAELLQVAA